MGWLDTLFLVCVVFGLIYSFLLLFIGDVAAGWLSHFHLLPPLTWLGGITAFGGSGFLLHRFSPLPPVTICLLAVCIGAVLAVAAFFIWVKPMKETENSTGYSMQDLVGKIGEVWTSIPATGLGEVVVKLVSGTTSHMASSLEGMPIPEGTRVVIVEVKDHVLYVTPFT